MSGSPVLLNLLCGVVTIVVWFLPLAGWPENFLKIAVAVIAIGGATVSWFWPANYSMQAGYVLVLCATFLVPFLIAYPFVSQEEAKEKARKYAEENLHGAKKIEIAGAKLNNWTWTISGWRIEKYSRPIQFYVDVHSKSGTSSNLRYTR